MFEMDNNFRSKKMGSSYRRRMAISFGLSLGLILSLFLLLPRQFFFSSRRPLPELVSLQTDDIHIEAPAPALPARMAPTVIQSEPEPVADADPQATVAETQASGSANGDTLGWGSIGGSGKASVGDTIPARPLLQTMPEYPKEEKKRKVSGIVRLLVFIDTNGRAFNISVIENTTGSKLCEQAAIAAARNSRYQPAMVDNRPVVARTVVEFGFRPE